MNEETLEENKSMSKSPVQELKLNILQDRTVVLYHIGKYYENPATLQCLRPKVNLFLQSIKVDLQTDNPVLYNEVVDLIKKSEDYKKGNSIIEAFDKIDKWLYNSGLLQFRDQNQLKNKRSEDE